MANRKHSKIAKLPLEIRDSVNSLLVSGKTIEQILDHLGALVRKGEISPESMPSKSSVGRYSKGFLAALERSQIVGEQARAIVAQAGETGMDLEEAGVRLVLNEMLKLLMPDDGKVKPKVLTSVAHAIAKIQSSSASRERAKIKIREDLDKRTTTAAKSVEKKLKKQKGLTPELVESIKNEILGIPADATA